MPILGSKLRALRNELGLSQAMVAEACGMRQQLYARLESPGVIDCYVSTAERIAKFFKTGLDQIVGDPADLLPKRIQLRRVAGWRLPSNTVKVARPTLFGNPFVGDGAVEAYRRYLTSRSPSSLRPAGVTLAFDSSAEHRAKVLQAIDQLRGKNLACFCPTTKPCHADVLLSLANR